MKNRIDDLTKGYMLALAGYRCEYCKRLLTDISFECEHIWPESRGGLTVIQNLAISCRRCNENKRNHVEWIDPSTGGTHPLFNPMTMRWEDHFRQARGEVIGISPIGRATTKILFQNTPQYLPPDLQWDKIEGLYENEPLYYFLNHMRYKRLRNDFHTLYKQLIAPLPSIDFKPEQIRIARFARDLLLLELLFTRSRIIDVTSGINYARTVLSDKAMLPNERAEILNVLSILYQQRATIHFQKGNTDLANQDQKSAFHLHKQAYPEYSNSSFNHPKEVGKALRAHTLKAKYCHIDMPTEGLNKLLNYINELDQFYATSHYAYLVDLVLLNNAPPKTLLEHLYEHISNILIREGYGTIIDHAKLIILRRRWWVLHFIIETDPKYDTLIADTKFWRQITMFNELRELDTYMKRISYHLNPATVKNFLSILHNLPLDN
jgi:hypothetical protein